MKQKLFAMALAAALLLSLSALAAEVQPGDASLPEDGTVEPAEPPAEGADTSANAQEASDGTTAEDAAQPDQEESGEEPGEAAEEEYIPDPVGALTFKNLERRLRENNLSLLALEENIQSIQVTDFDKMYEDLRDSLNGIATAQWMMTNFGQGDSYAAISLGQTYSTLRETFEDLKDGKIQKDSADVVRQLRNAQEQMVMAGQSMYIALADLELSEQSLDRSLAALDRSLEELELRYQMGQISSLTLKQAQGGRTTLVSGRQTLQMNVENLKTQLELMIGAELTGQLKLGQLPAVTGEQLEAMDLEADLAQAKENSYSLYAAQLTLKDARDAWQDAGGNHTDPNDKRYQFQSAKHTWQGAQYTYNAAVQNFETGFRSLYLQVKDYQQILAAARTSLAVEQDTFAAAQLKYEQGNLSHNALLEAQDKVSAAQETVDGAAIDLFSAYNSYRWAVDYGILN